MNKKIKITDEEWLTLHNFAHKIASDLKTKLPTDWPIPEKEICSEVLSAFLDIIPTYRPGELTLTSYCFKYGKIEANKRLWQQYADFKRFATLPEEDEENNTIRHKVAKYDPFVYRSQAERNEILIDVPDLVRKMPKEDL